MRIVASITIDHDGNPTSGAGDVLVGDRDEQIADVAGRLAQIAAAHGADVSSEDVERHAAAIVDGHTLIAPGDPIPDATPAPVAAAPDVKPAE